MLAVTGFYNYEVQSRIPDEMSLVWDITEYGRVEARFSEPQWCNVSIYASEMVPQKYKK
jgi:hypothetical protein